MNEVQIHNNHSAVTYTDNT